MASKGVKIGLVAVMVIALWAGANAQSSCTTVIISMSPCLNYITGNSSIPSSSCCSQLKSVLRSQPQCLCQALNGGGSAMGLNINQTRALALPAACNVQTPPTRQCNAASPTDSPPEQTDSPTSSDDPGTGSKTVPTTGGDSSNGSFVASPLCLLLSLLFVASYASNLSDF
ncbi:hypothetical protein GIB67_025548 [Kingdonia uniflora]|uniref:Bifunctional inhibitor/plant lipid transfer protein/seed storage helical domain-containing protein n=1 Tax=Kingdonia uniflora TaxID=39325 RepID=A0A7J7M0D2_9MAGN|nr:hypothetical protein GIB67_025548 [Kingdonia uniflora]